MKNPPDPEKPIKKIKAFSPSGWHLKQKEVTGESWIEQHSATGLDRTTSFSASGILGKDMVKSPEKAEPESSPTQK
jgi:hypothetical protein